MRVQQAQTKAMLSVNRELIQLYWDIGREIVYRQEQAGWGQSVLERLADDLQKARARRQRLFPQQRVPHEGILPGLQAG